jgi:murein DD-endopeptidase MepM/ murein hydrolase activator NlpD
MVGTGWPGPTVVAQRTELAPPSRRPAARPKAARNLPVTKLPAIESFVDSPSQRFPVDFDVVRTGHPYLGTNANRPHTGCHVYFTSPDETADPGDPTTYPPIYAVADGYVSRIDTYFRMSPIVTAGRTVTNRRYGVTLAVAQRDGSAVNFHYSIEPMIDPGDEHFYLPFIKVEPGQQVRQGDVIAYMYLPESDENENSHIHFNLMHNRQFQAPAIFDRAIVDRFRARWGWRGSDGHRPIPACMGFQLSAPENPFGTGAKLRL